MGIVLQVEDRSNPPTRRGTPQDLLVGARDLRTIVEELWAAGAEAVAVNGERMTPTTAVIDIGPSILVNSAYLAGPYQVTAIGPDDLYARLSASPGFVDFIRARAEPGAESPIGKLEPETVDMPAFAGTVTLRYARPQPSTGATVDLGADDTSDEPGPRSRPAFVLGLLVVIQRGPRRAARHSPGCPHRS